MALRQGLTIVCVAALAALTPQRLSALAGDDQGPDALAAAKASPEIVGALSKEIGATPEQAAGAAGALFGTAKSRLKPEEFAQVAKAVPGMDLLLKAAPATDATSGALSKIGGSGGLAAVASSFSKLGLKPELVAKAVPVLTSMVTKSGGSSVGNLLASVLK
jgi:hypothetical protein